MYRILQSLFILLLISGCASTSKQDLLGPQEFSDAYIERFEQLTDGFDIERQSALQLTLFSPEGADFSIYLGNAYAAYQRDPNRLSSLLDEYIDSTAHVIENEADTQVRIEQVIAVIKDKSYVSDLNNTSQPAGGTEDGGELYYEALNAELLVIYVQDNERSVRILNRETITSLGLQPDLLRERAVANLARRLSGIQTRENKGLYLFELDGFYEASLILLDDIWQSPALKVDGEIVVALPARDVLMVTGSNSKNIDFMRDTAAKVVRQSAYAISPELFVRRNGIWSLWPIEKEK